MSGHSILDHARVYREERTGRLRRIRGEFALPAAATAEDAVTAFLRANGEPLGLPAAGADLERVQDVVTPTGRTLRFRQRKDGIPIFGSEILVRLDPAGRARQIDMAEVGPVQVAAPPPGHATMSAGRAAEVARQALGVHRLRRQVATPAPVYLPGPQGLRLGYLVLVLTVEPVHDWQLVVDAYTGEILFRTDLVVEATGQGLVFDPNPVVSSGNAGLRDPTATTATCGFAGTPLATIDAQRVPGALDDITQSGATYSLDGPYVHVLNSPQESSATAFNYSSGDPGNRFEAVMSYHHVDALQRYLQGLGISGVHSTPVDVDPHANQSGGSYSSGDDTIRLGDSGPCQPDRGEDADSIVHEYGHAIQHSQVPGWGAANPGTGRAETRAMGEGFGDILATVYFAPDHPFQREVVEDWCYANTAGLRRVDGTKVYPGGWLFEEHADGEIWSAALWNIYRAIGGDAAAVADRRAARDELLKSVVLSHFRLLGSASMPDGAEAVMEENAELREYRLRHGIQVLDSFHQRGLLACQTGSDLRIDALWSQQAETPATGYQKVEEGQDNWFYATVRNAGTAPARAFVVTFSFKSPFTSPSYPSDFRDHVISAAAGFDLAPGASTTVHARWPEELIPPIPAGSTIRHGCIFAEVWNPVDHAPATATSLGGGAGKLAQRNTDIVDLVPDDAVDYQLVMGSTAHAREEAIDLEVIRPAGWQHVAVSLHHRDPRVIRRLLENARRLETRRPQPVHLPAAGRPAPEIPIDRRPAIPDEDLARAADVELHEEAGRAFLSMRPALRSRLPYLVRPGERMTLGVRVQAPAGARPGDRFTVEVAEHGPGGEYLGGFDVQVNVVQRR